MDDMDDMDDFAQDSLISAMANYMDWITICGAAIRSGPLIRDRWLKKSDLQWKAMLLKAQPTMPLKHRPDIDHCALKSRPHQRRHDGLGQHAFPNLNVEDLVEPNSMLILLDARTFNPPYKFAFSDHELVPP